MTLTKPKSNYPAVTITARDSRNGTSKTMTVYETTPQAVIDEIRRALKSKGPANTEQPDESSSEGEANSEPAVA